MPISSDPPQAGADTLIGSSVRLILLDCFETLVAFRDWRYHARQGVVAFLQHFAKRGVLFVVVSDAEESAVRSALDQAELTPFITRIYHAGNAAEALGEGRTRKRLDVPLCDAGLAAAQAVFIGDSPADAEAARHHRVAFIRVPRSEDEAFTFARLISGPSRYHSGDFSAVMLDAYQKQRDPQRTPPPA